jgi:hypothetical protein
MDGTLYVKFFIKRLFETFIVNINIWQVTVDIRTNCPFFVVVLQPNLEVIIKLVNVSIIKCHKRPLFYCAKPDTRTGQR